jgi:hypothetical protein
MNLKYIAFMMILWLAACTSGQKANISPVEMDVKTTVIGVGYSEDIALTDSYSVYYALQKGVNFEIRKGELKLKMDYNNSGMAVPVEDLTNSSVSKITNGFYVYEYPYTGKIRLVNKNSKTASITLPVKKPFSYLSRLLGKCILQEYRDLNKKVKGTIYITDLSYDLAGNESILIKADVIINELVEEKNR